MDSNLIKENVRLELSKHYSFDKDYIKFSEAQDGLTDLVIKEIESELSKLQTKVYQITGKGEVMMLFNEILGIGSGT